jgi:hypothetical protein
VKPGKKQKPPIGGFFYVPGMSAIVLWRTGRHPSHAFSPIVMSRDACTLLYGGKVAVAWLAVVESITQ